MKTMRAMTDIMHLYVSHTYVIWGLLVFYFFFVLLVPCKLPLCKPLSLFPSPGLIKQHNTVRKISSKLNKTCREKQVTQETGYRDFFV